ncbi:hypothetical protein [Catellatospora sichuanensis]|uniref:hypothetical protein n=1 Tax=Catellatospora sichuanensis TaxID=1969805 RepID=UPI001182A66C|nr:hypothetical protein [Catellatospora sichuanensis]
MDSLAHDEPTQRVEPGAAPARDEAPPSRPGRSGTLVAPPPPGLVALTAPGDTDTPWRRPDDPHPPVPQDTAPQQHVEHGAAARPEPVTDTAEARPEPVTESTAARPEPVTESTAARPEPVTESTAARPEPVTESTAARPEPVTESTAARPEPVTEHITARPEPVAESVEDRPEPVTDGKASPDAEASPQAEDVANPDSDEDLAADPESEYASGRTHPAWLGEPTGRFDLDLPEPGRRNPSWLGEPTRRLDPDEPFDQYALPADPPPADPAADSAAPDRPLTAPGRPHAARSAVTVDLADQDDWHADLPDADTAAPAGRPAPVSPAGSARPTVALPAAHRPVAGAPHAQAPGMSASTEAFTMPVQEIPRESWIDPRLHGDRRRQEAAPARKRAKRPRPPRRAGVAMPLLILFGLVAAFFSWVSAEPLWLAVGHGKAGTLTVTSCAGSGLTQRCVGEFATPARDFTAASVNVLGPPGQAEGLSAPARMVGAGSHRAYVTNGTGGLHLRWMVGLSIVLLCSIAIVFATGAMRLPERHERLAAVGLAFAGPLLITIGFLAATF